MVQVNDIHSYDKDSLKSLKIPELKELCKKSELAVDGKKDELIQRILDFIETDLGSISKDELDLNDESLNETLEENNSSKKENPSEEKSASPKTVEKMEAELQGKTDTIKPNQETEPETKPETGSNAEPETKPEGTSDSGVKKFTVRNNLTKEEEYQRLVKRAERFGLPKPDEEEFFKAKPEAKSIKKDEGANRSKRRNPPSSLLKQDFNTLLKGHEETSKKKTTAATNKPKEEVPLPFEETKLNFKKFKDLTEEEKLKRRLERFATGSK